MTKMTQKSNFQRWTYTDVIDEFHAPVAYSLKQEFLPLSINLSFLRLDIY
jgi:hypothetical protein